MTLIISGDITLRKTYVGIDDPDAAAYITAVEAADTAAGQSGGLETAVKVAIHSFVKGCKADGIWPAIKASCILAGARTLAGALVPLAGTAPTNFNFVSGDYDRKTGLVGNGSNKYLNSNRTGNADPQNSHHIAVYVTTTASAVYAGVESAINRNTIYNTGFALRQSPVNSAGSNVTGLRAASRSAANLTSWITGASSGTYTTASVSDTFGSIAVFARNNNGTISNHIAARLAFYSIGESLDLALLDARVTDLINKFAEVIP